MVAGGPTGGPTGGPSRGPIPTPPSTPEEKRQRKQRDDLFAVLTGGIDPIAKGHAQYEKAEIAGQSIKALIELSIREGVVLNLFELRKKVEAELLKVTPAATGTPAVVPPIPEKDRVKVLKVLLNTIRGDLKRAGVSESAITDYITNALKEEKPEDRIAHLEGELGTTRAKAAADIRENDDMYSILLANPKIGAKRLSTIIGTYQTNPALQFDENNLDSDPVAFLEWMIMAPTNMEIRGVFKSHTGYIAGHELVTKPRKLWGLISKYVVKKKYKGVLLGRKNKEGKELLREGVEGDIQMVIDFIKEQFDENKFDEYDFQGREVVAQKKAIIRKLASAWRLLLAKYAKSDEPDFTV